MPRIRLISNWTPASSSTAAGMMASSQWAMSLRRGPCESKDLWEPNSASIAPASCSQFWAGTVTCRWHQVTSCAARCCLPDWFDVDRVRFPGLVRCRFVGRADDSGTRRQPILPSRSPLREPSPDCMIPVCRSGNLRPFGPAVETEANATALLLRCRERVSAIAQLGGSAAMRTEIVLLQTVHHSSGRRETQCACRV